MFCQVFKLGESSIFRRINGLSILKAVFSYLGVSVKGKTAAEKKTQAGQFLSNFNVIRIGGEPLKAVTVAAA